MLRHEQPNKAVSNDPAISMSTYSVMTGHRDSWQHQQNKDTESYHQSMLNETSHDAIFRPECFMARASHMTLRRRRLRTSLMT